MHADPQETILIPSANQVPEGLAPTEYVSVAARSVGAAAIAAEQTTAEAHIPQEYRLPRNIFEPLDPRERKAYTETIDSSRSKKDGVLIIPSEHMATADEVEAVLGIRLGPLVGIGLLRESGVSNDDNAAQFYIFNRGPHRPGKHKTNPMQGDDLLVLSHAQLEQMRASIGTNGQVPWPTDLLTIAPGDDPVVIGREGDWSPAAARTNKRISKVVVSIQNKRGGAVLTHVGIGIGSYIIHGTITGEIGMSDARPEPTADSAVADRAPYRPPQILDQVGYRQLLAADTHVGELDPRTYEERARTYASAGSHHGR